MRVSATVYEIDPRRFRKDRFQAGFLVVFWILWAPATFFVTGLLGRVMLAALVHPDGKQILFGEIAQFLREHGFRFEARNERAT